MEVLKERIEGLWQQRQCKCTPAPLHNGTLAADPLPQPRGAMSSTTISRSGYILGGGGVYSEPARSPFCIDMATLINRANIVHRCSTSIWKALPDTPLTASTAAILSGRVLAVGGYEDNNLVQSAVYMFIPFTNSWVELSTGKLPVERYSTTSVLLSNNRVMVMGGRDNDGKDTSTCFIGSVIV